MFAEALAGQFGEAKAMPLSHGGYLTTPWHGHRSNPYVIISIRAMQLLLFQLNDANLHNLLMLQMNEPISPAALRHAFLAEFKPAAKPREIVQTHE